MEREDYKARIRQMLGNVEIEEERLDYYYDQNLTVTQAIKHFYSVMDVKIPPQLQGR